MCESTKSYNGKPKFEGNVAVFEMGEHTLRVSMTLHQENRQRLCKALKEGGAPEGAVILLKGGDDVNRHSGDVNEIFHQEPYFHWAFGVLEPGLMGAIEVDTERATLFCPRLPQAYVVWMGRIPPNDEFKTRYAVDAVHYVDEIAGILKGFGENITLLTLKGVNSDSNLTTKEAFFDAINKFTINNTLLHPIFAECRVTKSKAEIEVMRFAAAISSKAHCEVMRKVRPGMKEYQLESIFIHHSYYHGGCRHQAYTSICGSGINSSVLHYGHAGAPNARTIRDGDICLFDMGSEYYGYTADITCSFPANGVFTDDQRIVYNAVLAANQAVFAEAKPGVSWVHLHGVAYRAMLHKLKEGGLLKGEVEDMMKVNLGAIFQPHGLGHLLGLDVHDVGGYLSHCPSRPTLDGFKNLRMARDLMEGMVVTIEPGCYFIDVLLDKALSSPSLSVFIVPEVLKRFRGFGGVRIEDDVLITKDGTEDFTKVPRTVEEIEALMAKGREEEQVFIPQLHVAKNN